MAQASPLWYVLWVAVAVFGVLTWYLDKFSQRRELIRLSAIMWHYIHAYTRPLDMDRFLRDCGWN